MPYIENKNNRRKFLDDIVNLMISLNVKADGDLNYIFFAVAKRYVKPSYNNYRTYMSKLSITYHTEGELRIILIALAQRIDKEKIPDLYAELDLCNREIYRKLVANYEEEAEKRNGAV